MYLALYPLMVVASLLCTLLTFILAPLLALTAGADGNLPRFLYWLQTFDASLDDCRKPPFSWTGSVWSTRTRWLWRNPAYGFDYWPWGIAFDSTQWTVRVNSVDWFIATGPWGAFCIKRLTGPSLKLGWKVWAYWQNERWAPASYSWGPDHRAPICFTPW